MSTLSSRPLYFDVFEQDAKLEAIGRKKLLEQSKFLESISIGKRHKQCVRKFIGLRDNKYFSGSVVAIIFLAGALVGIQTYSLEPNTVGAILVDILDVIVLWVFVAEIVIKFLAEGSKPWVYFFNSWNRFDFAIVAVGFMPIGGGGAVTALRLLRLLRVLKLVRALPKLQVLVIGLLKSLSSIGYIGALLGLVFYLYAIVGMGFFGANDPVHMDGLFTTMLTLFRAATLEDWTDLMYTSMYGCEFYGYSGMKHLCVQSHGFGFGAALYWVSFVLISSLMVLNLFIGVIASSMQDAQSELNEVEAGRELGETDESLTNRLAQMFDLVNKGAKELDTFAREETKQIEERKTSWLESQKVKAGSSMFGGLLSELKKRKITKVELIKIEREEDEKREEEKKKKLKQEGADEPKKLLVARVSIQQLNEKWGIQQDK